MLEAYLALWIFGIEGREVNRQIGINEDEVLFVDLGKFSMTDSTLCRCRFE